MAFCLDDDKAVKLLDMPISYTFFHAILYIFVQHFTVCNNLNIF